MSSAPSPAPTHERERLELDLRTYIQTAEKAYRAASVVYTKTMDEHGNMLDDPDAARTLQEAVAAERISLENYTRALKAFCDLVIHNQRPK